MSIPDIQNFVLQVGKAVTSPCTHHNQTQHLPLSRRILIVNSGVVSPQLCTVDVLTLLRFWRFGFADHYHTWVRAAKNEEREVEATAKRWALGIRHSSRLLTQSRLALNIEFSTFTLLGLFYAQLIGKANGSWKRQRWKSIAGFVTINAVFYIFWIGMLPSLKGGERRGEEEKEAGCLRRKREVKERLKGSEGAAPLPSSSFFVG